jgi:putative ABC transport system ATP-binding protein
MNTGKDPGSRPLIGLEGITKVYGSGDAEVRALRGIDMEISGGEFVASWGPAARASPPP